MNPSGNALVYSTYLGGSGDDTSSDYGIAVNSAGDAYVTGLTDSSGFPTVNAYQATYGGGGGDAFITELNPAGSVFLHSTYFGTSDYDESDGIALDSSGDVYMTGVTSSSSFPVTNSLSVSYQGGDDAYIVELNLADSSLVYSTYLGGLGYESPIAIAVDGNGTAYITGYTNSSISPRRTRLRERTGAAISIIRDCDRAESLDADLLRGLRYERNPSGGGSDRCGLVQGRRDFCGSRNYLGATASTTFVINPATPTLVVDDAGGTYDGKAFPGTATVAGVVSGVDDTPSASWKA